MNSKVINVSMPGLFEYEGSAVITPKIKKSKFNNPIKTVVSNCISYPPKLEIDLSEIKLLATYILLRQD
jgi:hypothetical protein